MKPNEIELRTKVARACRILAATNICAGITAAVGHVSARIPGTDQILIKGRGYKRDALEFMRPKDQIVLDLECNVIKAPKGIAPPAEIKLYTQIYRTRHDVGAIVHAHPRFATVMSVIGTPMSVVCHEGAFITSLGVPVYDDMNLISTDESGNGVAYALGQGFAALLKAHGAVTVGKTVEQATVNMIDLEEMAKMNVYCLSAAGPDFPRVPLPEVSNFTNFRRNEVHELPWLKQHGFRRLREESGWTWDYWCEKIRQKD